MGVEVKFTKRSIDNYFSNVLKIVNEEFIRTFSYLGEQAVKKVRNRPGAESWFDQTGNLRSSIGYAVASHGKKQIESAFEQVLDGKEGTQKGRQFIDELISKYNETYALIVVAGMDYAERVESLDNKDVLASTEIWAKSVLDSYVKRTINRIESRIRKLSL